MVVPPVVVLEFARLAASYTLNQSQRKLEEIEAQTRLLQEMALVERDRAQADILTTLASSAVNLASRQMDLVFETFRATQEMIKTHHASLLDERNMLARRRIEVDEPQEVRMTRRIGEINHELLGLSDQSSALGVQANRMAVAVRLPLRLPTLALAD